MEKYHLMGSTYRRFKCPADGKIFKVRSGGAGGGPWLEQYDGEQYNTLDELDNYPENTSNPQESGRWNQQAEKFASFYSDCDRGEFNTLR